MVERVQFAAASLSAHECPPQREKIISIWMLTKLHLPLIPLDLKHHFLKIIPLLSPSDFTTRKYNRFELLKYMHIHKTPILYV